MEPRREISQRNSTVETWHRKYYNLSFLRSMPCWEVIRMDTSFSTQSTLRATASPGAPVPYASITTALARDERPRSWNLRKVNGGKNATAVVLLLLYETSIDRRRDRADARARETDRPSIAEGHLQKNAQNRVCPPLSRQFSPRFWNKVVSATGKRHTMYPSRRLVKKSRCGTGRDGAES